MIRLLVIALFLCAIPAHAKPPEIDGSDLPLRGFIFGVPPPGQVSCDAGRTWCLIREADYDVMYDAAKGKCPAAFKPAPVEAPKASPPKLELGGPLRNVRGKAI